MHKIIKFKITEIEPEKDIVFKELGIQRMYLIAERVQNLYDDTIKVFKEYSKPVAIYSEISKEEFEKVFKGEGNNSKDTPVEHIFPKANSLALFTLTMGNDISEKIETLFRENDFASGHILDCIASKATDKAVRKLEAVFSNYLQKKNHKNIYVLSYSPGYCGWDICGQKKLFEYLHPEKIGITLNDSFLMIPLKSVSGVLISGKRGIHKFNNDFDFCLKCETKSCRRRLE